MKITSTRRLFLAGTGIVGSAAALAACGQQSAEEQASKAAEENESAAAEATELPSTAWERMGYEEVPDGGTLTLAVSQLPNNWNYNHTEGLLADLRRVLEPQGFGALKIGENNEIEIDPDFIVSAELTSEDPQVVSVKYNPDAKWDDGKPIVIADLISQWKAQNGTDEAFLVGSTVGMEDIEEIKETDDEFTGEIHYKTPYVDWITLLYPDLPASASKDAATWNEAWVTTPYPSKGPFKVTEVDQTGGVITLGRNDKWWGRAPKLEKVIFKVVDQTTKPQSFANAELDAIDIANGDELTQAKTRSDAAIQASNGLTWTHLTINTEGADGVLGDVKVREAIARGIDRDAIGRAVVGPLEAPIVLKDNFVYMPGQEGYEDSFDGLTFDPEAAGKLLDEAGWALEGEKRSKDGKPLTMSVIVPADTKSNSDRARQVQTNLNSLGFEVEMQTVPSDGYFDDYIDPKQFDMVTFSWVGTSFPETSAVNTYFPVESGQNYTNFAAEGIKEVNDKMKSAFDQAERVKLANELSKLQAQAFTIIPFYATPIIVGLKKGIVNYGAQQFESTDWTAVGIAG